ncbi:hypothetical protein GCM10011325_02460 [Dyadobacter sediminis]|nr:hypothetical protein GCM10011325_02460 [Dyadobacter sediminis]
MPEILFFDNLVESHFAGLILKYFKVLTDYDVTASKIYGISKDGVTLGNEHQNE